MSANTLGHRIINWGAKEASIELLVLIGSRARTLIAAGMADEHSDWDFQVATSNPEIFLNAKWLKYIGVEPIAYVIRSGRLGGVQKVSVVCDIGELDIVTMPITPLREIVACFQFGSCIRSDAVKQSVADLSAVLLGGYKILKGAAEFSAFYEDVARKISLHRLSDEAVCQIAEGFICDFVSTFRKINRGELIAGQRWLHQNLADANFRLLHELRQRGGLLSYPDARRLEHLCESRLMAITVDARPTIESLSVAVYKMGETCRDLVAQLVGKRWVWPDLSRLRLGCK